MSHLLWIAGALGATALVVSLGACGTSATEAPSAGIDAGGIDASGIGPDGIDAGGIDADGRDAGGGDVGDGGTPLATSFVVGGTVTGLDGASLVLQNNAGNDLMVEGNGAFEFLPALARGATFDVTVKKQPTAPSQTCTVTSGKGTLGTTDGAHVIVACATDSFSVGGTLSGLVGNGLVLQNNGGDALTLDAADNGSFSFATSIASGAPYDVEVKTQPTGGPNEECTVSPGAAGAVTGAPVTSVIVACGKKKRVFVTSTRYNANLGGLAGADAKCQARADAAALGGTYKAWLSDSTGSPSTRFTRSLHSYVRVDGTIVAKSWADLTDGTLVSSISVTELNTPGPTSTSCGGDIIVWTNTATDGARRSPDSCGNWTGVAGGSVSWGLGKSADEFFTSGCNANGTQVCPSDLPVFNASLYCFEQ